MAHVLNWDEVSRFVSRNAKRYARYLKSVLQVRADLPQAVNLEKPSEDTRRRVLTEIFLWLAHSHPKRPIQEIDIRAVAWLLRIAYPCHPVFDSLESLRLSREEIFDGLNWVIGDVQFEMKPDSNDGAVLVAQSEVLTRHFDPLYMIAPQIGHDERVPFSQRMAAQRIAEYMFRVACTIDDGATENDVNDLAIQTAANRLLEVVTPLADSDDDKD